MECPSCKHEINSHMRDKHMSWPSYQRPHCVCGCGITQEEIEGHHAKVAKTKKAEKPSVITTKTTKIQDLGRALKIENSSHTEREILTGEEWFDTLIEEELPR